MLRELLEKRANLIAQARALIDGAEAANRDLSDDENTQYLAIMADVSALGARIDRLQRQAAMEADLGQSITPPLTPDPDGGPEPTMDRPERFRALPVRPRSMPEYRNALDRWYRGGLAMLTDVELRALQADSPALGGYLYAAEAFVDALIKAVDDWVYIRTWGTGYEIEAAESLGVPSLDTDPADADWTSELSTGTADSSMAVGKRELHPHPLAKRILVSRKLIRMAPSAEDLVRDRLAYKFQITWEKAALTGTGDGQPLGVFVASDDGISTGRDVSTDNTTTEIKMDNLIRCKYTLKPQYWNNARWLFHRDAAGMIARMKDGEGQYIWRESVRAGEPDRLLARPVYMSEYAPNTFTTGLYVGILGDFSMYWYADALNFELQRLDELYAATNQYGFIARWESDGMPVLEEAFVRVTLV